jgi:hypothetical protein
LTFLVGLPLLGGGVLLNSIGIPLFVVGGRKNESTALYKPPPPPVTVSAGFGYGSASLKVTF